MRLVTLFFLLGNRTQSTNLSGAEHNSLPSSNFKKHMHANGFEKKSHRNKSRESNIEKLSESSENTNIKAKNTVVNANGDNFETTLSR